MPNLKGTKTHENLKEAVRKSLAQDLLPEAS